MCRTVLNPCLARRHKGTENSQFSCFIIFNSQFSIFNYLSPFWTPSCLILDILDTAVQNVFPVPYFSLPHSRDPQAGHSLATSGYPHFGQLLCTMLFHIILILPIIPSAPPVPAVKQRNYGLYGQYNMYLMDCMTPCTFQL